MLDTQVRRMEGRPVPQERQRMPILSLRSADAAPVVLSGASTATGRDARETWKRYGKPMKQVSYDAYRKGAQPGIQHEGKRAYLLPMSPGKAPDMDGCCRERTFR
ncbi:MAG: hypothetical protein MZV63_25005 [Marinilabiliales bacterium]|nr:hypothetical protein [Marinilabiliales bacterium]